MIMLCKGGLSAGKGNIQQNVGKRKNADVKPRTSVKPQVGTGGRSRPKRKDGHRKFTKATAENHEETSRKRGALKREPRNDWD